jgi:endonuclease/exonuclease/phosphatase family metal-dependent hydrolase
MTFNIRYGTALDGSNSWKERRDLVLDVVREYDPAILGLQEALRFQTNELREAFDHLGEIGVARRDGGEYAAILYDTRRIEVLEQGTFWFSSTPDVPGSRGWGTAIPRICTWGRFRLRDPDSTFYVYNLHWDHRSQESRERGSALLLERIAARSHPDDPVLVTGDFNAGESNPAFRGLLASGLTDTFRAVHPETRHVGTFNDFEGNGDGEKIDAVLAGPGWEVLAAAIVRTNDDGRYPSDHFPVTAEVRLETAP